MLCERILRFAMILVVVINAWCSWHVIRMNVFNVRNTQGSLLMTRDSNCTVYTVILRGNYYYVRDCATDSKASETVVIYRSYGEASSVGASVKYVLSAVDEQKYPHAEQGMEFEQIDL